MFPEEIMVKAFMHPQHIFLLCIHDDFMRELIFSVMFDLLGLGNLHDTGKGIPTLAKGMKKITIAARR